MDIKRKVEDGDELDDVKCNGILSGNNSDRQSLLSRSADDTSFNLLAMYLFICQ